MPLSSFKKSFAVNFILRELSGFHVVQCVITRSGVGVFDHVISTKPGQLGLQGQPAELHFNKEIVLGSGQETA